MLKKIQYNVCVLVLVLGASIPVSLHADSGAVPMIVTTIKPLAIIAKSAVGDAAEVEYLLPANQSPHSLSLPISALKKITEADLIVWIGRDFETRSAKTMAKLSPSKKITVADEIAKLVAGGDLRGDNSQDNSYSIDPHLWLDPTYGNSIAAEIQTRLGLPIKKIIAEDNIQLLKASVMFSEGQNYLSHHAAYQHFIRAFELPAGMSIRNAQGHAKGVQSQLQLRNTMAKANFSCIFIEPQYQGKDAAIIAAQFDLPLVALDPQGLSQPLNNSAYEEFMAGLVAQFKACFQ